MGNELSMGAPGRLFVGRDREIEEVASGIDEAAAGRGGLFLLVGAAGIGKTRLADEAVRAAASRGMTTLWGRCWETGGAPAYWPWVQVLRELVRGSDGPALVESVGAAARFLAPLLPELVEGAAPGAGQLSSDPVQDRFRLFEVAVALLRAGGQRTPLCVVLDDLHAADPSSLALLHFVARNLRGLRVLIVGTYRDEEARLLPEVSGILTDVAREGAYLPLGRLGRAEVAALVTGAAGRPADDALVDAIERATEGNPLFLSELLRLLVARGDLGPGRLAGQLPIPDTVKEVIGRRIARLGPELQAVLASASVVGRDFGMALLTAVTGLAPAELARRLDQAERAGLLLSIGRGAWRFSHVLVREALYRDIDATARVDAHQKVAEALEASAQGDAAVAEIAHHRLAALPEGDAAAAAGAARRAADRAMSMLAFEDAAVLLERAREALGGVPAPDRQALCELQLLEGMAWMRAGDPVRGRVACVAAADEARRSASGELLARAALGFGAELMLAQTDRKLVSLLEEALAILPAGPSGLRAQVLARLAAALQPMDPVQVPMAMAREAIAMARALGAPEILRTVLLHGGSALADYAPAAERAAVSEELAGLATAAGDRFQLMRAQSRLVFDHLQLGSLERSARHVDAYEAVAQEFRQARHIWPAKLMRAELASAQGRFDEAGRLFDEAAVLAERDTDLTTPFVFAWSRWGRALENERASELALAEEELKRLLSRTDLPSVPPEMLHVHLAPLRARVGDVNDVRRHLGQIDVESAFMLANHEASAVLAEPVACVQDHGLALLLHGRLRPHAGHLIQFGRAGMCCGGPVDHTLGILATVAGRHDEAQQHLEASVALSQAIGLRPYVAQGKYWLARLLFERRGPGDEAKARSLAAEARSLAEALGLSILIGRLERLEAGEVESATANRAVPPADGDQAAASRPASLPAAPAFSFVREGEYWTVTSADLVCRLKDSRGVQMLAELVASPGREFHVLALSGPAGDEADRGDAGEILDAEAIADYRGRLEELDQEISEAESWGDSGRLSRAREEREAIARELAGGVGLGGRSRRAGAAAERARTNVQRRIRGAIRKIGESIPALGTYLDRTVRTGTFCSYVPL